jgi:hypothetical protein
MEVVMNTLINSLTWILCLTMAWPFAHASTATSVDEKSIAGQAEINRAIQRSVGDEEAARAKIREVLGREDIRSLASKLGFDDVELRKADSAIDTLDGPELQRAAAHAVELDEHLSGGAMTITVSLVALLLIVIIVILLVK